ncbi:UNVERIFIED_CONTAM: hypothetical protein Sangu_1220900 [Sesamum angustifolium]|uniref:Uncharacterized protein n=1 Tax=Sesamum angustifolium TaxID=2727405 RepID=A0AAW2NHP5_9LAMI
MAVDAAGSNVILSSPVKGDKSRGVGVVGGQIHDSASGRTCHQVFRHPTEKTYCFGFGILFK